MTTIILYIYFASAAVQLIYWGVLFSRFAFYRSEQPEPKLEEPVSVVICARNEEANLQKNLPRVLEQVYPDFEVVVVNDASTDKTGEVLEGFQKQYSNLRVVTIGQDEVRTMQGKKYALSKGIGQTVHELLLLTDADCYPSTLSWISEMSRFVTGKKEILLGYGPYLEKKSILNKFIRFETVYTAIQYFSAAIWQVPYMGVGRNLMYRKRLYVENQGFKSHSEVMSGDDDLFMSEVANAENVTICLEKSCFIYSKAKETWTDYYKQKYRHNSTGSYYKTKHKILLGFLSLSHFLFYLSFLSLIILHLSIVNTIAVYLFRLTVLFVVYGKSAKKLQEKHFTIWLPFFDFLLFIYFIMLAPALVSGNTKSWK